jgi:hypothetical protein
MAGNPNYASVFATTIESRTRELANNVSKNNALLYRLREKGNKKTVSGGTKILQEIDYVENSSSGWYSGWDTLTITPTDVLTAAEYAIKEAYVTMAISGLELAQNRSKEQMIDLMEARITNGERTITNLIATGVYSDGTAASGKQIGGLAYLVASAPATGVVGGIDRATNTFWRNAAKSATTDYGGAKTSSNILTYFNKFFNSLVRGTDAPDLIVSDNLDYGMVMDAAQDRQILSNAKLAEVGFTTMKYRGADMVLDGGVGGACPASTSYFLNSDYIFYRPMAGYDITPLKTGDGDRVPTNQDGLLELLGFKGNLTMSSAQLQGVLLP